MILFSTALKSIAPTPPATQVAPMRPPKSACDELEGSPRNHVTRFHRMAPTSPAKITTGLMSVSSTSPPEMVLATCTDRKAPARFRQAAIATAVLGRNAPVAIDVAMALAVSWNPFVKSKTSAVTTTTMTISDASMDGAPFERPTGALQVEVAPPSGRRSHASAVQRPLGRRRRARRRSPGAASGAPGLAQGSLGRVAAAAPAARAAEHEGQPHGEDGTGDGPEQVRPPRRPVAEDERGP